MDDGIAISEFAGSADMFVEASFNQALLLRQYECSAYDVQHSAASVKDTWIASQSKVIFEDGAFKIPISKLSYSIQDK